MVELERRPEISNGGAVEEAGNKQWWSWRGGRK
jgi:hypothetical protein